MNTMLQALLGGNSHLDRFGGLLHHMVDDINPKLRIERPKFLFHHDVQVGSNLAIHATLRDETDELSAYFLNDLDDVFNKYRPQLEELTNRSVRLRNSRLIVRLAAEKPTKNEDENWTRELLKAVYTHRTRAAEHDAEWFQICFNLRYKSNSVRQRATQQKIDFERRFPNYIPPAD